MAKEYEIDLDLVDTKPSESTSTEFLKVNPMGKIPAFEGSDGYILTESIAIAIYRKCNLVLTVSLPVLYDKFPPDNRRLVCYHDEMNHHNSS